MTPFFGGHECKKRHCDTRRGHMSLFPAYQYKWNKCRIDVRGVWRRVKGQRHEFEIKLPESGFGQTTHA